MKRHKLLVPAVLTLLLGACHSGKKLTKHNRKYMERTYTSMKAAMTDATVTLLSDTVKVNFDNKVLFAFNKADINPEVFPSFERFAQVLNTYKKTELLIVGHTDSVGGDNANNRELSARRADSAASLLRYYKVAPSRIDTWGMGAKEPVASNETEEGRAKNRRVEFIILYDYDKTKAPAH